MRPTRSSSCRRAAPTRSARTRRCTLRRWRGSSPTALSTRRSTCPRTIRSPRPGWPAGSPSDAVSGVGDDRGAGVVRVDRPGDGVAVVVLNRPARLNALDDALFAELPLAFDALSRDQAVRVVVVTGAGDGFCAGADLVGGEPPPSDLDGAKAW